MSTDPHVQRLTLPLTDRHGVIEVAVSTDWTTGATRYQVGGRARVAGVFVIHPLRYTRQPFEHLVTVQYGDGPDFVPAGHRANRPVVYSVTLDGGTTADPDQAGTYTADELAINRATSPYTRERVPRRTAERAAAVINALLGHWRQLPDLHRLRRVAACHDALPRLQQVLQEVASLQRQIDSLTADRDAREQEAAVLRELVNEHRAIHAASTEHETSRPTHP